MKKLTYEQRINLYDALRKEGWRTPDKETHESHMQVRMEGLTHELLHIVDVLGPKIFERKGLKSPDFVIGTVKKAYPDPPRKSHYEISGARELFQNLPCTYTANYPGDRAEVRVSSATVLVLKYFGFNVKRSFKHSVYNKVLFNIKMNLTSPNYKMNAQYMVDMCMDHPRVREMAAQTIEYYERFV